MIRYRYVTWTILKAVAVVLLAFVALTSVFTLVEELREHDIGYDFVAALHYVGCTLPRRIYEFTPYVMFLGTLLGLGSLANHAEITVLRASGVSVYSLFGAVIVPAVIVITLGTALGEWVAPAAERVGDAAKAQAQHVSPGDRSPAGYWYRKGRVFTRIGALVGDDGIVSVRQYTFDENDRLVLLLAAGSARYDAGRWGLREVVEARIDEERVRRSRQAEAASSIQADPDQLRAGALQESTAQSRKVQPRKLSLADLMTRIGYLRAESSDTARYELALWNKLLQPLSILGLTALAVAFVVGPLRVVSMGTRLAVGTMTGLALEYLQQLFGPLAMVYSLPAVLAVLTPIAVCWIAGLIGLRRAA